MDYEEYKEIMKEYFPGPEFENILMKFYNFDYQRGIERTEEDIRNLGQLLKEVKDKSSQKRLP